MRSFAFAFAAFLLLFIAQPVKAEEESRFYIGSDFGFSIGSDLTSNDFDNDVGTKCDQFLRPDGSAIPITVDEDGATIHSTHLIVITPDYTSGGNCPVGDTWVVEHGGNFGQFANLYSGYHWPQYNLRGEVEYSWLSTYYDDDENIFLTAGSDPKNQEIVSSRATFNSVRAHTLFFNGYYDYALPNSEKWSFFAGAGLGWSRVAVHKSLSFSRNPDNTLGTGAAEFPPEAAGTTTYGVAEASDTLYRLQLITGADYKFAPRATIAFKLRYDLGLSDFSSNGHQYDRLRGHESVREPDGAPLDLPSPDRTPVRFGFETGDLDNLLLTIGLKIRL